MFYLAALNTFLHLLTEGKTSASCPACQPGRGWYRVADRVVRQPGGVPDGPLRRPALPDLLQRVARSPSALRTQALPSRNCSTPSVLTSPQSYVFFQHADEQGFRAAELPDLTIRPVDFHCVTDVAEPGIEVHLAEKTDGHELVVVYEAERFDAESVAGLLARFQELLEAVARDPDRRLSSLLSRSGD